MNVSKCQVKYILYVPSFENLVDSFNEDNNVKIEFIAFSLEVKKSFNSETIIISLFYSILCCFCLISKHTDFQHIKQITYRFFY